MSAQTTYLDDKFAGTYQKLLDTIERGVDQCSTDLLQTLLEEKCASLSLGLKAFTGPSPQSRAKLIPGKNITVEGKTVQFNQANIDFIYRLSDTLDLNELQCALLWHTYSHEHKERQVQTDVYAYQLCEDIHLATRFIQYYFQDRLSILQCVTCLMHISENTTHPYAPIARSIVEIINVGADFPERILSQLKTLVRLDIPPQFLAQDTWATMKAQQNLKEQKALLDILFLIHAMTPCPPKRALSIIQECEANGFGLRQTSSRVLTQNDSNLLNQVSFMYELVAIQVLGLEHLEKESIVEGHKHQNTLLSSPETILHINHVAAFLGNEATHSTFLLAWSYVLACLDSKLTDNVPSAYMDVKKLLDGQIEPTTAYLLPSQHSLQGMSQGQNISQRKPIIPQTQHVFKLYASRAIRWKVFDHLVSILKCLVDGENTPNESLCRNTLRILLNSILSWTPLCYLPNEDYPSLVSCTQLLFENEADLCARFWNDDYACDDTGSLLATARKRFPLRFSDFIQLLSSLTGTGNSPEVSKKPARHVFEYMSVLPTMTVTMRSSHKILFHETHGTVTATAAQPIRIVNENSHDTQFVIPQGTVGVVISMSHDQPLVEWKYKYSGWHLLVSLLKSLVEKNTLSKQADTVDFDHPSSDTFGIIHNILELIRKVLDYDSALAYGLTQHVEEAFQKTTSSVNSPPILVETLCSTFVYCSSVSNCPTPITTSALQCLTLLLPFYRNDVWNFLEIYPILPLIWSAKPTSHSTRLSSAWNNTTAQIQDTISNVECANGRYPLLIAFLDFILALVRDIQRSWWVSKEASQNPKKTKTSREYQMESLYVCLYYITQKVFPLYAEWRYQLLSERFLIGSKVLTIFIQVVQYFKESDTVTDDIMTLGKLRESILTSFLYEGSDYQVSSLLDIISDGAVTAESLYRNSRPKEACRAEKLTELALLFLKLLLQQRLDTLKKNISPPECVLEKLMLGRKTTTNMPNFFLSITSHIHYRHNITLPILSTNVASLVCRTLSTWKTVPPLIQYFGTADQAKDTIRCYLEIAKDHYQNERLVASIWHMITLLLETQPTLGVLFLECGDYIMPSPKSAVHLLKGRKDQGKTSLGNESAVRSAVDLLAHWQMLSVEKPTVLSNVLRFLATFWQTAVDHTLLLQRTRSDNALWHALGQILLNKGSIEEQSVTRIELRKALVSVNDELDYVHVPSTSNKNRYIRRLCCNHISKALAMRIMTFEIHLTAKADYVSRNATSSRTVDALPAGLKNLIVKLSEGNTLSTFQQSWTESSFDSDITKSLYRDNTDLLQFIGTENISHLLTSVGHVGFGDDDADGEGRQYGDSYLYDLRLAEARIESLYKVSTPNYRAYESLDKAITETNLEKDIRIASRKFLTNLCLANHNWSLVDSELILLRSFKTFIETCSCHIGHLIWSSKGSTSNNGPLFEFVDTLVEKTSSKRRDNGIALTMHSVLIHFIRGLTEDWIDSNQSVLLKSDKEAKTVYIKNMFFLVTKLCKLLDQENNVLKTGSDNNMATTYHRPLLETILLYLRTLRGTYDVSKTFIDSVLSEDSATPLYELTNIVCESFYIIANRAMLCGATATNNTNQASEEYIKDVTVVITLLEELVHCVYASPPATWLSLFSHHETIPTLIKLLYGGIELVVLEIESQTKPGTNPSTILISPYAQNGLYLLLTLSSIPEATEILVQGGLFELLCNNALTQKLQGHGTDVFLQFESPIEKTTYLEHNPLHNIWCLMLGVVKNILQASVGSDEVLRVVVGFIQIYKVQIGRAFADASDEENPMLVLSPSKSLSSPVLEEIERISMIMFSLSKYVDQVRDHATNIFIAYKDCSLGLIQRYLYFFTHPTHMQAQLFPINKQEVQLSQTFSTPKTRPSGFEPKTSFLMYLTIQKTTKILRNILLSLNLLTKVNIVLSRPNTDWPFGNIILSPHIHTIPGEPVSFGTILDCMNAGLGMIKQWKAHGDLVKEDPAFSVDKACKVMTDTVQACMFLLISQVMLSGKNPGLEERLAIMLH